MSLKDQAGSDTDDEMAEKLPPPGSSGPGAPPGSNAGDHKDNNNGNDNDVPAGIPAGGGEGGDVVTDLED